MIADGDFMKIYKMFVHQEYLDDDTFTQTQTYTTTYPVVKPIDFYT